MRKSVQQIYLTSTMSGGYAEHRAWIVESTDDELDEYILLISGDAMLHTMALSERQKRHFKHLSKAAKPHWTMTPAFWVLIGTFIVAAATLVFVVLTWIDSRKQQIPISQPALYIHGLDSSPTNLPQAKSLPLQTSPPASKITLPTTNAALNTNLLN